MVGTLDSTLSVVKENDSHMEEGSLCLLQVLSDACDNLRTEKYMLQLHVFQREHMVAFALLL